MHWHGGGRGDSDSVGGSDGDVIAACVDNANGAAQHHAEGSPR